MATDKKQSEKNDLRDEMLDAPPFNGPLGKEIQEKVPKLRWEEWLEVQTVIINEYELDMSQKDQRNLLTEQMLVFLGLRDGDGTQLLDLSNWDKEE